MCKSNIGYIGLGNMGLPVGLNLRRTVVRRHCVERTASKTRPALDAGAILASSALDLATASDIVFINVTDTRDVQAVTFGTNGIAAGARPEMIVVDYSKISPQATPEFAKRLSGQGIAFLDVPVTGGDIGAKAGTLRILLAADADAFRVVRPVIEKVGKTITHVGPSGMGQLCKLCNQIAAFASLAGALEAIELVRAGSIRKRCST